MSLAQFREYKKFKENAKPVSEISHEGDRRQLQKVPIILYRDLKSIGFKKTSFKVRYWKPHKANCNTAKTGARKELYGLL